MLNTAFEINFDGIVGPTHNYAGLSVGNLSSAKHINQPSNPRQAALQGLAKMKFLADLGVRQAVLPPQDRPDVGMLRKLGFEGNDAAVLQKAAKGDPLLLAACGSASAMWTANAATVSPSSDCADGRDVVRLMQRSKRCQPVERPQQRRGDALGPDVIAAAMHHAMADGPQGRLAEVRLGPLHDMFQDHLERGFPPRRAPEAHGDYGGRLYSQRICQHHA